MRKTKIYIPIEINKRELDSLLLFSIFASKQNFSVVLSTKQNLNSSLNYLKSGIYLMKSIGKKNFKFIKNLKKKGHKIVCLDIEGSHYIHKEKLINRVHLNNLNELEYFFCWGKNQKKDLTNLYPSQAKKLKVTGHPKVDILKKSLNGIYKQEAAKIKKDYGKFILITTFFPVYNFFKRQNVLSHTQMLKHADYVGPNLSLLGKHLLLHQNKNYKEFQNLLKSFNKNYKDTFFIIRPHPGENHVNWFNVTKKYENIDVIYDDQSTCSWILASDLMISCNCTTLLESFLMGKRSVNYLPYSNKKVEFALIKESSLNIYKKKNLLKLLNNYKKINFSNIIKKKIFSENIENFANKNSSQKILSFLKKIKIENKIKIKKIDSSVFLRKKVGKLYLKMKEKLRLENSLQKMIRQKAPEITRKEIFEKIIALKPKNNIRVDEILPGVFEIYEKN